MRHRADCSRWVEAGFVRVNRLAVAKPHLRLRVGDVLTLPFPAEVRVIEVLALAQRRGSAPLARTLYREVAPSDGGCRGEADGSYPPPDSGKATRSA
jgi:ribosome-associated heat shock protein Hsp15